MTARIDRTERLLNLVMALLAAQQPMPRSAIRHRIPGYAESPSEAAFERMFERDKDELRSMGIPIETVLDGGGEVLGYRIPGDRYAMEDLQLSLRERAAVAVAAQVWGQASAGPLASTALRKLESTPGTADTWAPADLRGTVALTSSDAALLPLMSAIRLERDVVFPYRTPSSDAPQTRTVSPWALRSSQGRWLLVGHDADRGALRTFRVSRITGPVTVTARERSMAPTIDFDPASVTQGDEPPAVARVRAERGRAVSVRQHAVHGSPGDEDLQVQAATREALVSILCGGGADVVVLDPPEIVEAVREALAAVARAHEVHP